MITPAMPRNMDICVGGFCLNLPACLPNLAEKSRRTSGIYFTVVSTASSGPHKVIEDHFSVLGCDNGTDVKRYDVSFERKF